MGSGVFKQNVAIHISEDKNKNKMNSIDCVLQNRQRNEKQKDYDIEVIEVSNIALAIRNREHTINVQLSLRCECLPAVKAFGSIDSMVVMLKRDEYDSGKNSNSNSYTKMDKISFIEIGRTQIVNNNLNPKFIKTFIFPFNEQKNQQIQFRVYHIKNPDIQDLSQQQLVGIASSKLDVLVDLQNNDLEIQPAEVYEQMVKSKVQLNNKAYSSSKNPYTIKKYNNKSVLKINCAEYQGGTSKYQIGIELSNFVIGRAEVYFAIEAWKFGEWVPVARSETRKPARFKQIEVNMNKFQGEDNSGIRIKIYQSEKQQQIGYTNQFSISDIHSDQKMQNHRVYNGGFVIGSLFIYKWKKKIRDSFIAYIVGGAKLHLILAIDFTNSNGEINKGSSLHKLNQNGQNTYTKAIRQIVGVLQYFSLQNKVAFYGFGAKLPPYYRSISQCFAMNGNYFNPNVEGGVEQLLKLYKQNLRKIKMHGPTKISQILNLAIKYASEEESMSSKSHSYYVLIIITDGKINDYDDAVQLIIKASSLPLSILFVGVSNEEEDLSLKRDSSNEKNLFSILESLDSDMFSLKSEHSRKICERDIVDFIKINDFLHEQSKLSLARQTFAQIPNHFIQYMSKKGIKPAKQEKSLKAAKAEFISEKIKSSSQKTKPFIPSFLLSQKKQMRKKLISLGFSSKDPILEKINIATNDLSYFIEVQSHYISQPSVQFVERLKKFENQHTQTIASFEIKRLESYLQQRETQNREKTLEQLQRIQSNQYGYKLRIPHKPPPPRPKTPKILKNPCLICSLQEIVILHLECGHSSICEKCFLSNPEEKRRCIICYHLNKRVKNVSRFLEKQKRVLGQKNKRKKAISSSSESESGDEYNF